MLYACDSKWWAKYYDEVAQNFKGERHTINDVDNPANNPDFAYDLCRHDSRQRAGFDNHFIHYGVSSGGNSGVQATNLAYLLGAKTILLLGMDCFGTHYFGDHPPELNSGSPYNQFSKSWEALSKAQDVNIINCSRRTALDCFDRAPITEIFED